MKHLFNKIKPVGKRVIVYVDTQEKDLHKIELEDGKSVDLYIANDYSWDSRITNFTQGVLLTDYKNLKAGDYVLVHHNSMSDECELDYPGIPHTSKIFAVDETFVYFGIDGDNIICIDGYMLAERIYEPMPESKSGLVFTSEPKQIPNKLKIIGKPESITDYDINDVAVVYKYSDYEMTHNVGGKIKKLIRLKYTDCLAKEI